MVDKIHILQQVQPKTEVDYAWAAGFFDGEGCVYVKVPKEGWPSQIKVCIGQTSVDVLEKFLDIFEVGTIFGPYIQRKGGNGAPFYNYMVSSAYEIITIFSHMWPYLGKAKREQFTSKIEIYQSRVYKSGKPVKSLAHELEFMEKEA
jgi:hypothetical protein